MKPLRVVLIDPQPLALQGLRFRLEAYAEIEIIGGYTNGYDGLDAIERLRPDAVFMEVELSDIKGIDLVQMINPERRPMIVFVTAHNQFAIDAFALHATDYLLKPITEKRLENTIDNLLTQRQMQESLLHKSQLMTALCQFSGNSMDELSNQLEEGALLQEFSGHIAIKDAGRGCVMVPCHQIDWIDAAGDYMCVHSQGQTHVMRSSMKALQQQLNPNWFKRIHRSTIVNVQRIQRVTSISNGERMVALADGTCLKVSRGYKDALKELEYAI